MAVTFQLLSTTNSPQFGNGRWIFYELDEALAGVNTLAFAFSVTALDPLSDFWDFMGHYAPAQLVDGVLIASDLFLLNYLGSANGSNLQKLRDPGWITPAGVSFRPGVVLNIYDVVGSYTVRWFAIRDT